MATDAGNERNVEVDAGGADSAASRVKATAESIPLEPGFHLPVVNGRESSTAISRGVIEAILGPDAVPAPQDWRHGYEPSIAKLTRWDDPALGAEVARSGLTWISEHVCDEFGTPIARWNVNRTLAAPAFEGERTAAESTLRVPTADGVLEGEELVAAVTDWENRGRVQPGVADAIRELVEHPEMLRLDGWTVAVIGGGAELSPVPALLDWGADVLAVARGESAERVRAEGADRPGRLVVAPAEAADPVRDPAAVAGWLAGAPNRLVVVDTLYAPGAAFLRAEASADAAIRMVADAREDAAFAWYGTPSDDYVDAGTPLAELTGEASAILEAANRVRGFRPAREDGVVHGIVDLQGPSYAIAKRIGRWRAADLRERGRAVSYTILPFTKTQSVMVSPELEASATGAAYLGLPYFEPETTAVLAAALLVWNLHHPEATRDSATFLTDRGVDGGALGLPYRFEDVSVAATKLGTDIAAGKFGGAFFGGVLGDEAAARVGGAADEAATRSGAAADGPAARSGNVTAKLGRLVKNLGDRLRGRHPHEGR